MKRFLITGGAGFVGSAVIKYILDNTDNKVINIDKLNYASNISSLKKYNSNSRYIFAHVDVCNTSALKIIFKKYQPDIVMHLAAETHVDRSIDNPMAFIQNNIIGTYNLLEQSLKYLNKVKSLRKFNFRFLHVSTDEVFGDLQDQTKGKEKIFFTEKSAYKPSSPYSATKAASDHLVQAWHRTYKLPSLITNCSNNFGPYQFPEKLIPLTILNAIEGKKIPVYGKGKQIRDWLYVEDHAEALFLIAMKGSVGETYNIGGNNEKQNIDVVKEICKILNRLYPIKKNKNFDLSKSNVLNYQDLITFVDDRPGHDMRYAIDSTKIKKKFNWMPKETFETALFKTVDWYLNNLEWCKKIQNKNYQRERLGILK
jgi:dTDP-glucose 4,6-dehydratase